MTTGKTGNIADVSAGATLSEQISGSLRTIRGAVVDETAKMATNAPEIETSIFKLATGMLETVSQFEDEVQIRAAAVPEMMSAESLYRPLVPGMTPTSEIARLYELINQYEKHLVNAVRDYDDEVPREAEMTLFRRMPYELDYLNISGSNIGEVTTALKVALLGKNIEPYSLEQIIALRKVLDLLKKDISVEEHSLMEIFNILDDRFGLAGPLGEVEFGG